MLECVVAASVLYDSESRVLNAKERRRVELFNMSLLKIDTAYRRVHHKLNEKQKL